MSDRGLILGGLLLFLGLVTLPVWYNVAAGTPSRPPDLTLPQGKDPFGTAEEMRASHMDLLIAWRDEVVRAGERTVVGLDGKTYAKSLTQTCMGCHAKRAEFCDRCHGYTSARLICWDCHADRPRAELAVRAAGRRGAAVRAADRPGAGAPAGEASETRRSPPSEASETRWPPPSEASR